MRRVASDATTSNGRPGLPEEERRAWERTYSRTAYRELPWYSPRPSRYLVECVEDRWFAPGSRVLDIGCGAGSNVLWLSRHGFRATGIDIAPGAVAAAQARARTRGLTANLRVADALALPFVDAEFSAALDVGCFHTLPLALRPVYAGEIARVLRPGSPFLLSWIGREDVREAGPPHRPSLAEVAIVLEPHFVFRETSFRGTPPGASRTRARAPRSFYVARLERRRGTQPALR